MGRVGRTSLDFLREVYNNRLKRYAKAAGIHSMAQATYLRLYHTFSTDIRQTKNNDTTLQFYTDGLGERMIVRQAIPAFEAVSSEFDLSMAEITIAGGGSQIAYQAPEADVNLYWWWHSDEQGLNQYLNNCITDPDYILCLSEKSVDIAEDKGYNTIYAPLAAGNQFRPLNLSRSGLGYAGDPERKPEEQIQAIINPAQTYSGFETVTDKETPEALNEWYNQKLVTFGMTIADQQRTGMVNNRVFEALASGTPFILYKHPTVESILGFEYPYQVQSDQETIDLVEDIRENTDKHLEKFHEYSQIIRNNHTYEVRFRNILKNIQ